MRTRTVSRCVSGCLSLALMLQLGTIPVYAADGAADQTLRVAAETTGDSAWDRIREELSMNGNPVTTYINTDENYNQEKTIIWAKGIVPPTIGKADSDFKREEHLDKNTNELAYITYIAPYVQGNGWYDVNKKYDGTGDDNLCFAAAASNALHWWLDQNKEYVQQYLSKYPDDTRVQKLAKYLNSFTDQQNSAIFKHFTDQYGFRQDGYWPDILIDQFVNGYRPKENGGTNDEAFDGPLLNENNLAPNGGFMFKAFGPKKIAERRLYDNYAILSRELKQMFKEGKLVMLSYAVGNASAHVVTLWGAEFNLNGDVSAVYLSDSDDVPTNGMVRYRVVNVGGKPRLTTHVSGMQGSPIEVLVGIAPCERIWESHLGITRKPLGFTWSNTSFIYDGEPKKPSVQITSGLAQGDDVQVAAAGEQVNAGKHTAYAVIRGKDANKYEPTGNKEQAFFIERAPVTITVSADTTAYKTQNKVTLNATVEGAKGQKPDGTLDFMDEKGNITSGLTVTAGKATYEWVNPAPGSYQIKAYFRPGRRGDARNYKSTMSDPATVEFYKKQQQPVVIAPIGEKRFGDPSFTLTATGGSGTGAIVFSSDNPKVISIEGATATITGAGQVNITATRLWDQDYNSESATVTVNVAKGLAPQITYPSASGLTYGQTLAESMLTGGSTELGWFAWENAGIVPQAGDTEQRVVFTANQFANDHYEMPVQPVGTATVRVEKAAPAVALTTYTVNNDTETKAVLTAKLQKVGQGVVPNGGTVKFVDCTNAEELPIAGAEQVALKDGTAVFTWTGMAPEIYKVKAVYSGDANYAAAASLTRTVDAKVYPKGTYPVIVETDGNGTAETSHAAAAVGTTVTLKATPNAGFRFKEWQITNGTVELSGDTFVMPDMAVTILAVFEEKPDVPSGGGSGGGGGSSGGGGGSIAQPEKPGVVQNPDGSTTETVTQADGTVIKTTNKPDGSQMIEITKKDGSSSVTNIDADGKTDVKVEIPDKVSTEASKNGKPVALPMPPVKAQGAAPTVHVSTGAAHRVAIVVPLEKAAPSTVAIVIKPDGTKQVARKSIITEDGLLFGVDGSTTFVVQDNSKEFTDVRGHWASDAIKFVSSHEIYNGTSSVTFAPDASITRGMLVKILHNLENNLKQSGEQKFTDVDDGAWYADAVQWAAGNGIVTGVADNRFSPEQQITRQDIAVMLYRYAGKPTPIAADLQYHDAEQVSDYAKDAVRWAVDVGIMNGMSDTTLSPKATATRAQTAAMVMRLLETVMA